MVEGNEDILRYFINKYLKPNMSILDVGSGGIASEIFSKEGGNVTAISLRKLSGNFKSVQMDFMDFVTLEKYDLIWCSHLLEHILNVNLFLRKLYEHCKENGHIAILVPPMKNYLAGGHVNYFTPATLCYNVILSGQDISQATVLQHGYNIVLIWGRKDIEIPELKYDRGDIETLAEYFPKKVYQGIGGSDGWGRIRADDFFAV